MSTQRSMTLATHWAIGLVSLSLLAGCGGESSTNDTSQITTTAEPVSSVDTASPDTVLPTDQLGNEAALSAVIGASEIPYPVYPNGSKYRIGGENGLKIVVFETTDSFEKVDQFYQDTVSRDGMPRLVAMNDYVRYGSSQDDQDPWATYRPGIVIHKFKDDGERSAVGADDTALTNIIMSF